MPQEIFVANKRMNEEGWKEVRTYQDYKEQFRIDEPDRDSISQNYQSARTHFHNLANSSRYKTLTKELGFEARLGKNGRQKGQEVSAHFDAQVDIWINQIRNAKITEYKFKSKDASTSIKQDTAQKLVAKWDKVIKLMKEQAWTNLNTELNMLENYMEQLNNSLKIAQPDDLIDLTTILGEGDAYTLASRLEGLLSRIQGEVLEQEVKKFMAKKMPTQVAVTGSVTVEGGGKIKPDLVALLLDKLELKNDKGEVTYRFENGELVDAAGNPPKGTVTLTQPELELLTSNTIGFSAKTTSGAPTFHQGYNIDKLIKDALGQGGSQTSIWQLLHFYQLGLQNVPGKSLDLYQRYAVSKLALQILGSNNAYIITAHEIIPTYQYIDKMMKRKTGLYFANKKIPVKTGNTLNSNFGSTNILGPKV